MPISIRATQYLAVVTSSAKFATAMAVGQQYLFTCNTDCWVIVAVTGGAVAVNSANAHLYMAGHPPLPLAAFDATTAFVHVIRDSADGDASLTLIEAC